MTLDEQNLFSLIWKKYNHNGLELYIRLLQASTNPKLLLKGIDKSIISSILESEEDELENTEGIDYSKFNHVVNDDDLYSFIDKIDMTSKFWNGIDAIKKLVGENKQVIVWGIFIDTIDRIFSELEKLGISSRIIYGATPLEERESIIESFKSKEFQVLITNPHTLAESVSLHHTCHDAIYFEYSFNLTHMLQSRDRINRLGLPENQYTQYYYLFLSNPNTDEDSIDFKTYNRLEEKKNIMLNSIEGNFIYSIDFNIIDDLKKILGKD